MEVKIEQNVHVKIIVNQVKCKIWRKIINKNIFSLHVTSMNIEYD